MYVDLYKGAVIVAILIYFFVTNFFVTNRD